MSVTRYRISEVAATIGVEEHYLVSYIEREWVLPAGPQELDDEDVARARLIHELQSELGVNEEAVPVILHLIDQLHALHCEIRRRKAG